MITNDELRYEVVDGIATITIDRPGARNALNSAVREGIRTAVAEFTENDQARVLILTGVGEVAFSAGADLKEMSEQGLQIPPDDFIPDLATHKPVIAAVNGAALAGGFFLAQQADLVIAAEHATFGITEARHGRGAPWAAPLPLMIPPRVALELLLTAQPISAARAKEVGLVNHVVPIADLAAASRALAHQIAANAPLSVAAGKAMVHQILDGILDDFRQGAKDLWNSVYLSADAQEGPLAFKEKRPPRWQGR
ncbi:carnitinyl-CoA dehydratase [mine drainage metagenome]|uniref:Carnitinyl-CoA dehydratase n=1 Tax=mine drainage metagenome TaxID=410659 RepID=A0A1J5Q476_9ZZZZ